MKLHLTPRFLRRNLDRFLLLIGLLLIAAPAWYGTARQQPSDPEAHYVKHEFRIPMRDGVTLFTQVYIPKDTTSTYPFLMMRTPFGVIPYGENQFRRVLGPSAAFDRAGYIFVFQDVRGRYQSQGNFVDMRPHIEHPAANQTDESTDTRDSIDWLLKNIPGNNAKVGIWGMSYPGFYAASAIIDSHPAIKAASPEAPVTDLFRGDDAYHNGAFMLAAQFLLYSSYFWIHREGPGAFDYGTTDGYAFFLHHGTMGGTRGGTSGGTSDRPALSSFKALIHNPQFDLNVDHSTYDSYWQERNNARYLKNIHCPVLIAGGWLDAEDLAGTFRTYDAIRRQNPAIPTTLVIGPWTHGEWLRGSGQSLGPLDFQTPTAVSFREQTLFAFFERYLKDAPAQPPTSAFYQTGANRWTTEALWPPANTVTKSLYLHGDHKLSFDPPAADERAYDEYLSDPKSPVPYVEHVPTDVASEYMYGDQRFVAGRSDVLMYMSDPLQQELTIAGKISPRLQVSTSGTDSDFDVKLIDVYPEQGSSAGYQLLVRGEPMRAKFRHSFSKPEPMIPGKVTALRFEMPDINHTFRRGHRIMVQIQSSWFPLTDLNPQTFVDAAKASPADFVKATERVYHTPRAASLVQVPVRP